MEPGPVRRMMTARGPRATGHLFLLGLLALLAGCLPRRTTVEAADDSFGDLNGAGAPADRCVAGLGAQAPLSFQARTAFFQGFRGRVLGSLLEAPRRARGTVLDGGLAPLRAGARPFAPDALESIRGDVQPGHHSHIPPLVPAHATTLDLRGVTGKADLSADLLIALRTAGEDERIAREIGESAARVRRGVGSLVIGVILPMGGSPGQRRSAGLIREGIEVRLGARDAGEVGIEVEVVDDSREGLTSAGILRQLEERGTVAIIGPLSRAGVEALVAVRKAPIPTISPTARIPPGLATGVYSAGGLDPTAAALLASYATGAGLRTVVVIHSSLPESSFEAREFVEGFRRRGGKVLAQLAYDPGTTDFQELLGTVATLQPDGLVLPLPPQDIQPLARQVTFSGLDTLGIQLLGTAGWTNDQVFRRLDPRHTEGVIVATPMDPSTRSAPYEVFVREYEEQLRKGLRSPVAALGYDAAGLLLAAIEAGARTSAEILAALEEIKDFRGATGSFTLRDGRLVRRHFLLRLRGRDLNPSSVNPR